MVTGFSHYDLLGVSPAATQPEIRTAWVRAVRWSHSDVGGSVAQTAVFNAAYETLKDPQKRREYDRQLAGNSSTRDPSQAPPPPSAQEPAWGVDDEWVHDEWVEQGPPAGTPSSSADDAKWLTRWYRKLRNKQATVHPPRSFPLRAVIVSASIFATLLLSAIAFYASTGQVGSIPIVLLLAVPVLPPSWRTKLPFARVLHVLGWLTALFFAAITPSAFGNGWGWVIGIFAIVLLVSLITTALLARSWDSVRLHR